MNIFTPAEVARNYIAVGKAKADAPASRTFLLAVLAGAFIALGGAASTVVSVTVTSPSVGRLLSACVFPGGLAMVLLAGSELFTGNCLMSIPLLEREISWGGMLKNWGAAYLGNFLGGALVAAGMVFGRQLSLFDNGMAAAVLSAAAGKCSLRFTDALIRGILCNFLVCIAVWISFAARDAAGKILGLYFPILIFVVCGFEHSVANMYYISAGLMAKLVPAYAAAGAAAGADLGAITMGRFLLGNLLPVTLGNIIGGSVCVGGVCWLAWLRKGPGRGQNAGGSDG